ncbi:pre T-cell antigen receptor alpha [Hemicordylus capensis]|uniref:pre T-cell antigen receptor alpha n=1 Tax=Hemicordylus capensis TaxID=884348 RepID=UPI0023021318|nr:pre T-cell antigen receptor alpha [Hemicordylus capensis]
MPQALHTTLPWRMLSHLLTSAALQLLTCSFSLSLFSTLAPPVKVEINGERKTLVVCMVNGLSEDALDAIWFSNGNGSLLDSFSYGFSREEDGTFSTVSQISINTKEFESWEIVTCYAAQNKTSRKWSTTSLPISEENMGHLYLDDEEQGEAEDQTLSFEIHHSLSQILLLLAIRMLLFKFILSDVLMTCCILYKREDPPSCLKPHDHSAVRLHRAKTGSSQRNCQG